MHNNASGAALSLDGLVAGVLTDRFGLSTLRRPFSFRKGKYGTYNWSGEHVPRAHGASGRKYMIRISKLAYMEPPYTFDIWATSAQTYGATKDLRIPARSICIPHVLLCLNHRGGK
jgi:hypothetical protein